MIEQTYFSKLGRRQGVALVIILAFLVLLVGVAIAFLSRALTERQVSNSSAGETKADILARSGLDVVMGDLKQEIVNGSVTPAPNPAPGVTLYYPKLPVNAVPVRDAAVAALSGTLQIPSLIRVSGTVAPALPAVETALASANAISTGISANGRSVSLSRWNAHYLIPRANTTGTDIDYTPVSSFGNVAPNWVMVTNSGPAVLTTPTNAVIGRYAYAIYDEGGLLDMNVAGYPSSVSGTQSGLKGSEALADLSQIGLSSTGSGINNQIDTLLGWRNYATLQPTAGSLSAGYNFQSNTTAASNYMQYLLTNTNGYLTLNPQPYPSPATSTSRTDQMFTSRQDLLRFARAAGWNQNVLQYMGTFTRDLEQPSFVPNTNRALIQSGTFTNSATFGTGNDAFGLDRTGVPSTDINPPFLEVRVTIPFTRQDGTPARVGDPLVLKRFPLSRLAWITSKGPSASNMGDATVQQTITALGGNPTNSNDPVYQFVARGTDANIMASFGLAWTGSYWSYNHGNSTGILRLGGANGVATLGREADFFELLKAAVNVGSIGKGSCYDYSNTLSNYTTPACSGYLEQIHDTETQLQILQIGANIIDQSKGDNFPTRIQFSGDPTEVRGVEDLPYLYIFRNWITKYSTNLMAFFLQPELWNPHSIQSSALVAKAVTPTTFRVRVVRDPTSSTLPLQLLVYYNYADPITGKTVVAGKTHDFSSVCTFSDPNYISAPPAPLVFKAGELNNCWGFREPTLLGVSTMPATCHMATTSYNDIYTKTNDTGILLLDPFNWINPDTGLATDTANKISVQVNNDNACFRAYLDYQDASGNWITYDEQVFEYQKGASSLDLHVIANHTTYPDKITSNNENWCGWVRTDPRSGRWGFNYTEYLYTMLPVDASNNEYGSFRQDGGLSHGAHLGGYEDKGFVGSANSYGNQYRGFQYGYWAENSIRATYETDSSQNLRYDRDPDGVARRTMGGYVTDIASGGTTASANQPYPGLPMYAVSGTAATTGTGGYMSRPTILHRPFRSVAELGYVFRDTPWGNINFSFPESGDAALLDVFCINETADSNAMVAGRVNLNSRQAPVLQALLSGVTLDKDDGNNPTLSGSVAAPLAAQLVIRTSGTLPLANRSGLVGTWNFSGTPATAKTALTGTADPNVYYTGFSTDIGAVNGISGMPMAVIPRQRDSAMRALADSGSSRVWNLLIDIIAQSGRYPSGAQSLGNFVVEGERRYWLHVAIDRYTGKVLDKQMELVTE